MEHGKMATRAARVGEVEWQQRVRDWRSSGKTQAAWCLEHGISTKTFTRWKSRIRRKSEQSSNKAASVQSTTQSFIPLEITDDAPTGQNATKKNTKPNSAVSVGIGRFSVEVTPDYDPSFLKRLLATLGEIA